MRPSAIRRWSTPITRRRSATLASARPTRPKKVLPDSRWKILRVDAAESLTVAVAFAFPVPLTPGGHFCRDGNIHHRRGNARGDRFDRIVERGERGNARVVHGPSCCSRRMGSVVIECKRECKQNSGQNACRNGETLCFCY